MSTEWLLFCGLLGLVIGSFCNVVIARMPHIIEEGFAVEVSAYLKSLGHTSPLAEPSAPISLSHPGSHCPHCQTRLRWYELIPVLSWLLQRARCRHCQGAISWQYPVVELLVAGIFIISYAHYGLTASAALAAGFYTLLLVAAWVDWQSKWLPDVFTLPLLWAGILASALHINPVSTLLMYSVFGCALGYALFAGMAWLFQRITGRDGLGGGDTKLLAALGAWLGPFVIPHLLLIASVVGLLTALWWRVAKGEQGEFAFGPALAIAGAVLFWLQADTSLMPWF